LISFRYLIVTLVAVFLALGLGVLAGTTVLDQGLVSTLKRQTHEAERRATAVQDDLAKARTSVSQLQEFITEAAPLLIRGRLAGQKVVLVTYDGSDPTARNEAVGALQQAGADLVAVLSVTGKMAGADPSSRSDLAALLGVPAEATPTPVPSPTPGASSSPDDLVRRAAAEMASRLAEGGRSARSAPHRSGDLLSALLDKGFLKSAVSPGDIPAVGGPSQVVLVVTGGTQPPPVAVSEFMLPLVEALGQHPATWLAVGESAEHRDDPLVQMVRSDASLSAGQMVTIDDLDPEHFGGVQLVLGLDALINGGRGGNYGIEAGSEGLLPKAG
jgi:copper transport outer membrane protein MctB